MTLFSGQQTTHLQRTSNASSGQILRTPSDYAPAPSSGSNISELASMMENRQSVLSPRANPLMMRPVSVDSDVVLPMTHNNNKNIDTDLAPQKPRRATIMRAAESGMGNLLPMRGVPTSLMRQQPQRIKREAPGRSNSSGPSYAARLPRTQQDLGDSNVKSKKSGGKSMATYLHLRRRPNASSDDEFDSSSQKVGRDFRNLDSGSQNDAYFHSRGSGSRRQRQNSTLSVSSTGSVGATNTNNGSGSREHSSSLRLGSGLICQDQLVRLSRMKLGHLLQVVIVLAVIALVYESHHKALDAYKELEKFKEEESLLLLHLKKLENQSIQLHENFNRFAKRFTEGGDNTEGIVSAGDRQAGEKEAVDFDLIHKQTEQLYHMEQELSHEVETLQKRIQLSARNHIIQEFGEGPVQVVLELDFGDATANAGSRRISILLWHDTPHAAWTWLEQIGNNVWDGAEFEWQQGHIIDAVPPKDRVNPERDGKIEFVEHSQHEHNAWTVGVRDQPNNTNGNSSGSMSMYINLQDNSQLHKHETCVGKVIDGFDALQKLLELSRSNGNGDHQDKASTSIPILIRKATAEHYVTKKAGMGK